MIGLSLQQKFRKKSFVSFLSQTHFNLSKQEKNDDGNNNINDGCFQFR